MHQPFFHRSALPEPPGDNETIAPIISYPDELIKFADDLGRLWAASASGYIEAERLDRNDEGAADGIHRSDYDPAREPIGRQLIRFRQSG